MTRRRPHVCGAQTYRGYHKLYAAGVRAGGDMVGGCDDVRPPLPHPRAPPTLQRAAGNARIQNVGKYQSCMVSKLPWWQDAEGASESGQQAGDSDIYASFSETGNVVGGLEGLREKLRAGWRPRFQGTARAHIRCLETMHD